MTPPARVLCVDDLRENLLALESTLADLDVDLVLAGSGQEALRQCLKQDFALILMDVRMPGLDGLETAELIRQRERSQHTPIIFLTAATPDDTQTFQGYATGAVDYLYKPLVPHMLRSKVAVFVDIYRKAQQIRDQAEQMRRLEQQEHERQLAEARERFEAERLREEIRLARTIQQKLFPAAALAGTPFDVAGASYPAEATGGDYYDYVPMRDGGLGVVIGDVSGHGFGPALLMAELRAYLRAFLLTRSDVGEILGLLNRALSDDAPEGHFATLLLARLDPLTRCCVFASAGQTPGYVLSRSGEVKALLKATGMPLAVLPDTEYPAVSTPPLEPGELLLLLTDGIVEAHGPDSKLFGMERVLDVVRAHQQGPSRSIVDNLYASVRAFCGAGAQLDDMTTIVIKIAGE
ncbi:MAG: PP2C family protein-serine/threonine phosphatase [Gemmataceae bacterium]